MKIQNLLKSVFGTAFIAMLLTMMSCDTATKAKVIGSFTDSRDSKTYKTVEQLCRAVTVIQMAILAVLSITATGGMLTRTVPMVPMAGVCITAVSTLTGKAPVETSCAVFVA
jgi:hypothetical protein